MLKSHAPFLLFAYAWLCADLAAQATAKRGPEASLRTVTIDASAIANRLTLGQGVLIEDGKFIRACSGDVKKAVGVKPVLGALSWSTRECETQSSLLEGLRLGTAARQRFFGGKASAYLDTAKSVKTSVHNKTFMVQAKFSDTVADASAIPFALDFKVLRADENAARRDYGNYYVSAIDYAPSFDVLIATRSSSSETSSSIRGGIQASWPGGGAKIDLEKARAAVAGVSNSDIQLIVRGVELPGGDGLGIPSCLARASSFERDVVTARDNGRLVPVSYTLTYFEDSYLATEPGGVGADIKELAFKLHSLLEDIDLSLGQASIASRERLGKGLRALLNQADSDTKPGALIQKMQLLLERLGQSLGGAGMDSALAQMIEIGWQTPGKARVDLGELSNRMFAAQWSLTGALTDLAEPASQDVEPSAADYSAMCEQLRHTFAIAATTPAVDASFGGGVDRFNQARKLLEHLARFPYRKPLVDALKWGVLYSAYRGLDNTDLYALVKDFQPRGAANKFGVEFKDYGIGDTPNVLYQAAFGSPKVLALLAADGWDITWSRDGRNLLEVLQDHYRSPQPLWGDENNSTQAWRLLEKLLARK